MIKLFQIILYIQPTGYFHNLSVIDNLKAVGEILINDEKDRKSKIDELIGDFELENTTLSRIDCLRALKKKMAEKKGGKKGGGQDASTMKPGPAGRATPSGPGGRTAPATPPGIKKRRKMMGGGMMKKRMKRGGKAKGTPCVSLFTPPELVNVLYISLSTLTRILLRI